MLKLGMSVFDKREPSNWGMIAGGSRTLLVIRRPDWTTFNLGARHAQRTQRGFGRVVYHKS